MGGGSKRAIAPCPTIHLKLPCVRPKKACKHLLIRRSTHISPPTWSKWAEGELWVAVQEHPCGILHSVCRRSNRAGPTQRNFFLELCLLGKAPRGLAKQTQSSQKQAGCVSPARFERRQTKSEFPCGWLFPTRGAHYFRLEWAFAFKVVRAQSRIRQTSATPISQTI